MPISRLSLDTIRLLGATVVISSAPSLVKELLDNALDASATTVEVLISSNTVDKIQLRDNGTGIPLSDIENLGKRAHTSKLRRIEDLEGDVKTLGFRGEALFGALGVAKDGVWITTRTAGEPVATKSKLRKGVGGAEERKPVSAPVGTTVTVEGLFGGIPVRKKQAEKEGRKSLAKIRDLMLAYVMARPHLKLSLKVAGDNNQGWKYSPSNESTARDAVLQLLGNGLAAQCQLLEVECPPDPALGSSPTITMQAFLANPDCDGDVVKGKGAFISVDRRPITSIRGTGRKIAAAYKTHLNRGRQGAVANPFMQVNIDFPSGAAYDPNVAPLKDEIMFMDEGRVVDCFEELCRNVYMEKVDSPNVDNLGNVVADCDQPDGIESSAFAQPADEGSEQYRDHLAREPSMFLREQSMFPRITATPAPNDPVFEKPPESSRMSESQEHQDGSAPGETMLRLVEENLRDSEAGPTGLNGHCGKEKNAAIAKEKVPAQMRIRNGVNLERNISDATDEDNIVDAVSVQIPSQPVGGNACNIGVSRAVPTTQPTAAAYPMEDISRYLQPRKTGETFQIAINDSATDERTLGAVKGMPNGRGRTPLGPAREADLNDVPEDYDSLFDGSEAEVARPLRPRRPSEVDPGAQNRVGPRLEEHNLHLLQQALEASSPPSNSNGRLVQTTLSPMARASTTLRTPPSSDDRQPTRTNNVTRSSRSVNSQLTGRTPLPVHGNRGQTLVEGSNANARVSLKPKRPTNSGLTTTGSPNNAHGQSTLARSKLPKNGRKRLQQSIDGFWTASRPTPD